MTRSSVPALAERLQAYFDDELGPGERDQMAAQLQADEELAGEVESLAFMRELVVGTLEREGEEVPQARFEQIWDEFDASVSREERMRHTTETTAPSLWDRVGRLFSVVKVPLAVGAAAAAVVALTVVMPSSPSNPANDVAAAGANNGDGGASKPATEAPTPDASPEPRLAVAPEPEPMEDEFSSPTSNEATIERLEFGGRSGTISHIQGTRGTTTVIWVQEDAQPLDTERSL
jgi:hypothetical protein